MNIDIFFILIYVYVIACVISIILHIGFKKYEIADMILFIATISIIIFAVILLLFFS